MNVSKQQWTNTLGAAVLSFMLGACSILPPEKLAPPPQLNTTPSDVDATSPASRVEDQQERVERSRFESTSFAGASSKPVSLAKRHLFPADEARRISLSIDGLPIPAFINEVFANQLGLSFEMAPEVASKTDLVTLRVTEKRNRQEIFEVARQVLGNYGVLVTEQGDLMRFVLGKSDSLSNEPPLIVTGNALPSVPFTHRPIFLVHDLEVISAEQASSLLMSIFGRQGIKIERDAARNSLTLQGPPDQVRSAVEMLKMFDKPNMKGRSSLRVDPLFVDADTLSRSLGKALEAQGYSVGGNNQAITLLPIKELGAMFVFAPNDETLEVIKAWVQQLDRVPQQANRTDGFFWYQVKRTGAELLANTLNSVMSGTQRPTGKPGAAMASGGKVAGAASSPVSNVNPKPSNTSLAPSSSGTDFVVDPARNMLLFRGEAAVWQELLPLIRELDHPTPQVLIEVIVADVTLTKGMKLGVDWTLSDPAITPPASFPVALGQQLATLGSGGFTWNSLNSSGSTRLVISALANDNKVSILQTPKILVRSGESASINVGQDVPIATTQSNSEQIVDGTNAIIQQIQYRTTGVNLSVTPTVYSDGRIDLQITQEVSGGGSGGSSGGGGSSSQTLTPIISTNQVSTSLSLRDGGSVLLGGLISRDQQKVKNKVPLLGDIPILGNLFSFESVEAKEQELMILIVPYLIQEADQAEALTNAFRRQLELHGK